MVSFPLYESSAHESSQREFVIGFEDLRATLTSCNELIFNWLDLVWEIIDVRTTYDFPPVSSSTVDRMVSYYKHSVGSTRERSTNFHTFNAIYLQLRCWPCACLDRQRSKHNITTSMPFTFGTNIVSGKGRGFLWLWMSSVVAVPTGQCPQLFVCGHTYAL